MSLSLFPVLFWGRGSRRAAGEQASRASFHSFQPANLFGSPAGLDLSHPPRRAQPPAPAARAMRPGRPKKHEACAAPAQVQLRESPRPPPRSRRGGCRPRRPPRRCSAPPCVQSPRTWRRRRSTPQTGWRSGWAPAATCARCFFPVFFLLLLLLLLFFFGRWERGQRGQRARQWALRRPPFPSLPSLTRPGGSSRLFLMASVPSPTAPPAACLPPALPVSRERLAQKRAGSNAARRPTQHAQGRAPWRGGSPRRSLPPQPPT